MVISTYLSCSTYSDDDFDEILEQLQEFINTCPKDTIPVIGGDFNASIGIDDDNGIIGEFGNPYRNDKGDTLRVFLAMNDLCSNSTFFQKDNFNMYSWCDNEENPKQKDHICIRKKDKLQNWRSCWCDE